MTGMVLANTRVRPAGRRVMVAALLLGGLLQACSPPAPGSAADSAPTIPSGQNDPAAYRGAAIAGQVCAQCHSVSTIDARSPASGAPSFMSVANRPETTVDSLSRWLTSSHPTMPNYIFTPQSVDDLAAYIMTLPGQPPENVRDAR